MSLREKLIADIESYCATTGYKPSSVTFKVMGSGSWFKRLVSSKLDIKGSTVDKFVRWMDENPPVKNSNPLAKPKRRRKKK